MSGTVPLREAALAAIAARLSVQLPEVTVERSRRAPVDVDTEALPRLVVRGEDWQADEGEEPGRTHYQVGVSVTGFVAGATDLEVEQSLSLLHAQVVHALAGWTPAEPGLGDVSEQSADFTLYDIEESARPAGEVLARFSILAVGPTGGPWSS